MLAIANVLGADTADLSTADMGPAIADSMARPGIRVLRLRTDRDRNVALHREVQAAVDGVLA